MSLIRLNMIFQKEASSEEESSKIIAKKKNTRNEYKIQEGS